MRTMSSRRRTSAALLILVFALAGPSDVDAQSSPARGAAGSSFDEVAGRAAEAREAGRLDEAVAAFRRGVELRPSWDEGWWYLGTTLYEQGRDADAGEAFTRFLALKPETGAAFALRGLCEFRLRRYERALADLQKARTLGIERNAELRRATLYHLAVLLMRYGQFEIAVEPLTLLARAEPETESLVEATGLLLLRLPYLPSEIPPDARDLVVAAGGAGFSWLARADVEAAKRFRSLVERYPDASHVHHAYGVFLLQSDSDAALAEFRREIAINPASADPHLEIAFELLRRGDPAAAKLSAREAVALAPHLPSARNALGRALVGVGEIDAGIGELETAVKLAPESPEMRFALANAYARAGRKQDAAREREIFLKLNRAKERE